MKQSEIRSHLDHKAKKILSLFDKSLSEKIKEKMYFAGGCIYSLNNNRTPKDYDIFLRDSELIEELKLLNIWSYVSDYALTYGKFQIAIKYFGNPDICVGQFDFKHNMYYYIPFTSYIYTCNIEESEAKFEDYTYLNSNLLCFNKQRARDIEGVYLRIEKFTKRGMEISPEEKKEIKKRTSRKSIRKYKKSRKGGRNYY